jgi:DNA modification methylase
VSWEIRNGDAPSLLREMPDGIVQTCITSPPYWGLRDYGTAEWEGGDTGCDHRNGRRIRGDIGSRNEEGNAFRNSSRYTHEDEAYRGLCNRCGARRIDSQLGLEPTPDSYVQNLVEVFREVRRVMRDDAVLWLNLGDSYAGSGKGQNGDGSHASKHGEKQATSAGTLTGGLPTDYGGLKQKDLVGIPWRVAFALQADGWYLRSDIIWAKPNPMPESVRDRPTRSHEYIFLLSKGPRYFFDQEAVREPHAPPKQNSYSTIRVTDAKDYGGNSSYKSGKDHRKNTIDDPESAGRNIRSVWQIATQPYKEAHFATFPEKLVEPCVLAGSAEGDLVLDCFAGSGTVGVVALRHGRSFIGLELNPTYVQLARHRILDDAPLLNSGIEAGA